ncbi:MAG: carbamoyltransferase HypF [Pseudomonadota bacterium]
MNHNAEVTRQSSSLFLRRRLRVTGIVQGVGFRPYVWRLAMELNLSGWVRNDAAGVEILVEGERHRIEAFTRRLPVEIPPLARVRELSWDDAPHSGEHTGFVITESGAGRASTMIGHDTAVCLDCLTEMFDPADRRWRYAFINCTNCGPRYTLTRCLPYDRAQTSMAPFPLCPDCEKEYRNPADRRFHAEPTACPVCGPRLALVDVRGNAIPCDDPITATIQLLQAGQIVAIKGLGGFHLACDARNAEAVQRLRARKQRDEKPFAVMAANPASLAEWVEMSEAEQALLTCRERPIVLLRKKCGADAALPGIAPGLAWLGVMLPYAPLQWLIFHEAAGRPAGTEWIHHPLGLMLVMTSANPGGEPLVSHNDEAIDRLGNIADAVLLHDRDIVVRCDDSVVRMSANNGPQFIRRARGYTPRAIRLSRCGPSVLALGSHLKNTLCVTRGNDAFVSQHIGGLDNPATCNMLQEVTEHLLHILQVRPEAVAHDLHPDFFSSHYALELADAWGLPTIAVQHHHAHIAAVAAEHGVERPLLGLALDGVGLGSDHTSWGGELLRVDGAAFTRLGHLTPLPMPGGDKAAKEPWRMAAAALFLLGRADDIPRRFTAQPVARQLRVMLEHNLHCPPTTSLGRWFDAAAGLLGVRNVMTFEGQAAMLLEGLAEEAGDVSPLTDAYVLHADGKLDLLPLLARLADETDARRGAALFHATLARALADWTLQAAEQQSLDTVTLGGGCFLNHILSRHLANHLTSQGLRVLEARQIPPNDGGLSLGQAWVAISSLNNRQLKGTRSDP